METRTAVIALIVLVVAYVTGATALAYVVAHFLAKFW